MPNEVQMERLKEFSKMLRDPELRPVAKFDLTTWADNENGATPEPNICGTSACALGCAAWYPPFMAEGLTMQGRYFKHPEFEGSSDVYAGARFFGIEVEEAEWLFFPEEYNREDCDVLAEEIGMWPKDPSDIKPEEVADRVDYLIGKYSNAN